MSAMGVTLTAVSNGAINTILLYSYRPWNCEETPRKRLCPTLRRWGWSH